MTHRRDPIFYAMQCGLPPSDAHSIICTTIEMKLWEHLRDIDGGALDLLDVRLPIGTMTPMMVVVQLRQRHAGQANAALMAVLSSPYLHPKFAVAVDEDIDPSDVDQVMWAIATRVHAARDVQRWDATRVFALDNASPIEPGMSPMYRVGTKMLIDATKPPPRRAEARRRFEPALPPSHATVRLAEYLLQTPPRGTAAPSGPATEQSIRPLLGTLERAGALQTIVQTVDPRANLAALAGQSRRQAVLFDSVAGHFGWRVASGLLNDRTRWAAALALPETELLFTPTRPAEDVAGADRDADGACESGPLGRRRARSQPTAGAALERARRRPTTARGRARARSRQRPHLGRPHRSSDPRARSDGH